jgi:3-oxoadipate enol-lactonase
MGLTATAQEEAGIFDWNPVVAAGHRLIRDEARGQGRSQGTLDPSRYTWPSLAADLLALCEQIAPGQVVSGIGSSMGSATLLHASNSQSK